MLFALCSLLFALCSLLFAANATQMGNVNQYATAFRNANRLHSVQKVTISIACHILLSRIHLDYVAI